MLLNWASYLALLYWSGPGISVFLGFSGHYFSASLSNIIYCLTVATTGYHVVARVVPTRLGIVFLRVGEHSALIFSFDQVSRFLCVGRACFLSRVVVLFFSRAFVF